MTGKRFQDGVCYLIAAIYIIFVGSLMCMSIFLHCQTDIYGYEHAKAIERHMPLIYCGIVVLGVGAAAVGCVLLKRISSNSVKYERICKVIFWCCGAVILAASLFWIFFYESVPVNDQRDVYAEARRIAGFLDEPFDTGYFSYFPRNRGITLLAAAMLKLLGNHLYSGRIINLVAAALLYYSVCKATQLLWKNPIVTAFTSFLLMLFYPIVVYTSYLYGTLLSVALCSAGMYAAFLLSEKEELKYGLLLSLAFSIGIAVHQSAAIGLLAAILYLLISGGKKKMGRNLFLALVAAAMVFVSGSMVDLVYERITGADPNTAGVPASCTIYMGITATEGAAGPGSQDGSYTEIFNENGHDAKAANRDALHRIGAVLREYLSGEREISFFLKKIQYQWLDPTFGARKTIVMNDTAVGDEPNSEAFIAFYNSPLRSVVFKLSVGFMLMIYFGALVSGVNGMSGIRKNPACQAQLLIWLYVIGGGAFQLIWESFSRYCLGYFIWLIPMAAYGIWLCCEKITLRVRQSKE